MNYGVYDGFLLKPYETIKEQLEADLKDIFGDSVNLAAQSPQGQLVGIISDGVHDVWEMAQQVYGSYDIDEVEGRLLDKRAELRGMTRLENESDTAFRVRIKEQLQNSVLKLRDELEENLLSIEGVEDVVVKYKKGITRVFVVGGNDTNVATAILDYMPPGALEGNVSIVVTDRCNDVKFYRPSFVPVKISVDAAPFSNLECECKEIDVDLIKKTIANESCGVGYGDYLYSDYIRNILSMFRGLRVSRISISRSNTVDKIECDDDYEFATPEDYIKVKGHEKIFICEKNISVLLVQ